MERVSDFLKEAGVYYLATVEGDQKSMLDAYPNLRNMYDENDGNTQVFYFRKAVATFSSFTAAPETVEF